MAEKLRVAWLTTGRGPGSYAALDYAFRAVDAGLPVEIATVFVNRDPGEAPPTDRLMDLVRERGIPLETLSSVRFRKERGGALSRPGEPLQPWRTEYDAAVADRLASYGFDLGVLFGYMLIATEPLFGRFTLINDHPALPEGPIGTWQQVIAELMRSGERESGCMWHRVTGDVDRGAPLTLCRFPIFDDATKPMWLSWISLYRMTQHPEAEGTVLFEEIRRRGLVRERPLMTETLRAAAEGRLPREGEPPLDLTAAVEAALATDSARR